MEQNLEYGGDFFHQFSAGCKKKLVLSPITAKKHVYHSQIQLICFKQCQAVFFFKNN